jgi:hypothetical protein
MKRNIYSFSVQHERVAKKHCAAELRMDMDQLNLSESPKRAKVEKSDGLIETLFKGMRGMKVDDNNIRRKIIHLGRDELSNAMQEVLSERKESDNTLTKYRGDDWRAYLSNVFRTAYGACEEVWVASPADASGCGGQIFRISFRRQVSVNSIVKRPLAIQPTPVNTHCIDDMVIEEFAPGSIQLDKKRGGSRDDVLVEDFSEDKNEDSDDVLVEDLDEDCTT